MSDLTLDIIIPHWMESWGTGRSFFDMLGLQRGIDFSRIRVLLIHDGTDPFDGETFSGYPYRVEQHRIAHGGVSAARNFGIEMAAADWVCFCDFDDFFSGIYSLKQILGAIDKADGYDLLWGPIYLEDRTDGRLDVYGMSGFNTVFIHNKYIRRTFLKETGLRFNEELAYSEDSAFMAVLNVMTEDGRIGEIKTGEPLYTWAQREGSCTTDKGNTERNIEHLFRSNLYIAGEYEELMPDKAGLMKWRAVTDMYFALGWEGAPACRQLKQQVSRYWRENRAEIRRFDRKTLERVYAASRKSSRQDKRPVISLAEWLKEIGTGSEPDENDRD